MTTAILISACALLFTVGSFWWLNARSGRLRMTEIVTFAAHAHARRAKLRIPVTLYNTGAKPLVIVDLRLELSSAGLSFVAPSQTFRSSMEPKAGDVDDFPYPYVVPGRSVVTRFVEFNLDGRIDVMVTGQSAQGRLSVLVSHQGWRTVGACPIRTDAIGDPDAYIAYSNDPAHWPERQLEKANKALAAVREQIQPTA